MEASVSLLCSKVTPFSPNARLISHRPFNKQFLCNNLSLKTLLACNGTRLNQSSCASISSDSRIICPLRSLKASYSTSAPPPPPPADSDAPNPFLEGVKNPSFDSLKSTLLQLTPLEICKWCLALAVAVAAAKWTANLLLSPFFWMYFSWTWLFWPWMVAIALAIAGLYSLTKHLKGTSTPLEQLAIVTSAFTWLTLVPPAHFNGFLEGWPFVFFFIYHYFFFLNVSVRKRLYGDYNARVHDKRWDITLPDREKLLFCGGVAAAHWAAAFEGVELHLIRGGWRNLGIWCLIAVAVFTQYHSTLYLAKYSEKVVVPTAVVEFGPYRFVRHPIYASTMLLFVSYFAALRAPISAAFVAAVCLVYYGRKAALEEAAMVESFGERYSEYASKVGYKLIPFVY